MDVDVSGPSLTDNADLMIQAGTQRSWGSRSRSEHYVAPHLESGTLVRVLADWCPPFPGYFLYYPSRGSSRPPCRR